MDNRSKKLNSLIDQLDAPKVDADDLKALCLATISDIDNDSAQHTRAKIEALKLLKELVVDANRDNDLSEIGILSILKKS